MITAMHCSSMPTCLKNQRYHMVVKDDGTLSIAGADCLTIVDPLTHAVETHQVSSYASSYEKCVTATFVLPHLAKQDLWRVDHTFDPSICKMIRDNKKYVECDTRYMHDVFFYRVRERYDEMGANPNMQKLNASKLNTHEWVDQVLDDVWQGYHAAYHHRHDHHPR